MSSLRLWPGRPFPLGAQWDGAGVNFALFSEHASQVELCLFDATRAETQRISLPERSAHVWHGYLPDLTVGQLYGYRVHGRYDPGQGHRFRPEQVLLDPYARTIARAPVGDGSPLLGQVVASSFDWSGDRAPLTPWGSTLVLELHVRGFTRLHPGVPEQLRGTYAGLGSPAVIEHLRALGVTAVELLPVQFCFDEPALTARGLRNYWGYNTLGFFAPDPRYAASGAEGAVDEFKAMVRALHAAGIEVILDVVYNHTAEGNHDGPTLSFRGIDNASYYRLAADRSRYVDFTGCGNSLNVGHPRVLQLIMDSLRYWAREMHVDGFRFDLASALARELWEVDRLGSFFDIIQQEPLVSQLKLIAEPWDLGPGGYQVGNFPVLWTEWNGKYRDCVRRFWKGQPGSIGELASRLAGSSDLYESGGRCPHASLNFITAHDGFTLRDLVSYDRKHNEANGEGNRDGNDHNDSWNCGVEGPSSDPAVKQLRARQQRNLLVTLLLSQGVPMLLAGDEQGQTQRGNNNTYCQDSPLAWIDWELDQERNALLAFVRKVIDLRRSEPVFRRRRFFRGRPIHGADVKDLYWIKPDGSEMSDADWRSEARVLGMALPGDQIPEQDEHGRRIRGNTFALLFNAQPEPIPFRMGARDRPLRWTCVLDTSDPEAPPTDFAHGSLFLLQGRSVAVLRASYGA